MVDEHPHTPVMAGDVLDRLAVHPGFLLADLTVGAGGHAEAFLHASAPTGRLFASDRDTSALAIASERLADDAARIEWHHGDSEQALRHLAAREVRPDGILLDLGVSSMQLDDLERGFGLREDAALDMRMDRTLPRTAADLLAELSRGALEQVLREADEPRAARLAQALVERRRARPFRTTGDLRRFVEEATGRRGGRIHPATRVFMGLRMAVNDELPLLARTLPLAIERLAPHGRLAVIAFHSGEDRLVKHAFAAARQEGLGRALTDKPLRPGAREVARNKRARSARLRVFERCP